ncbi:hypothetical protein [Sphingomicrobium flavum]|uniref:hypothetical protein n=1 Tax=Sphingomicrobium flavum TaxID=1229164 RepID=UPI0021ADE414|nr:hypothetical protein [Sphingomicrobium flavum]
MRIFALLLLAPLTSGCVVAQVAETAVDVATLPVKVVSSGVDAVTTSQSEADEKRGREMRKAEEAHGKALRKWEKECVEALKDDRECAPKPEFIPPEED